VRRAAGLTVIALSLLVTFAVLEIGTRLFVSVSDIPWHISDPVVGYRLQPGQRGSYHAEGTSGTFRINNRGFNNDRDYRRPRVPGTVRIALVGDSYVEALMIDRGHRVFEGLETGLRDAGVPAEVDSYGISGFGTGQEMLLLESEALQDHPDLAIVLFVQNDLADTACILGDGGEKPCFALDRDGALSVPPWTPHQPNTLARLAMTSALLRFLAIDRDLAAILRRGSGGPGDPFETLYASHPDERHAEAWRVVEACFARMAEDCARAGTVLMLIHQPLLPRGSAARLRDVPGGGDAGALAARLAAIASRHRFVFLDLGPSFGATGDAAAERFLNLGTGHWNADAHRLVARALVGPARVLLSVSHGAQTSASGTVELAPNEPAPHAFVARTR
jgi:hypothetical protein